MVWCHRALGRGRSCRLFSHQWERVATPTIYTRPRENTATRDATLQINDETRKIAVQGVAGNVDVLDELQIIMQKNDDCKEIRLALTRIATRPEKCLQTFRLVVTEQYGTIYLLHCLVFLYLINV
jgi:hypothetical protein